MIVLVTQGDIGELISRTMDGLDRSYMVVTPDRFADFYIQNDVKMLIIDYEELVKTYDLFDALEKLVILKSSLNLSVLFVANSNFYVNNQHYAYFMQVQDAIISKPINFEEFLKKFIEVI